MGRDEYYNCYLPTDDDVELARRFAVRCWQGFGASNRYKNGFRSSQQSNSPRTTVNWRELPEKLEWASNRLLDAQIESLPAIELLKRYDTADVFAYLDPPYLPGTRKSNLYEHEMTLEDHEELLRLIVNHPGRILISGYDNDLYNKYLTGWHKVQKKTTVEMGLKRVETLWMNYEI